MRLTSILFRTIVALVLFGCASTDVAPIAVGETPQDKASDEAGLWFEMDRFERRLKTAAIVVRDPALNEYVRGVTCKVTGLEYCADLRVYVIDAPLFNASMAPNGLMMVYTGLLLRAENEAQLAFVLGHEFTHYRERHSLQGWRAQKNAANASVLFAVAVGAAGVPDVAVLGNITLAGRLFGFNRDQEREADEKGLAIATAAGYDPSQASALWKAVINEVEASSSKRKKKQFARASLFSTHPLSSERVEALEAMANAMPKATVGLINHRNAIRPFLNEWLDRDIARRDLGEHVYLIKRLQDFGLDKGVLCYRLGEAYRVRREDGDIELARDAYAEATGHADVPVAAWRELGNVSRRLGNITDARTAYKTYLEKAPNAQDHALVGQYLREIASVTTVQEL